MIGAEVRDLGELPAPLLRDRIVDLAFHRGLLLLPCGASTVRFCPPLCLTARQVEIGLELLDSAMAAADGSKQGQHEHDRNRDWPRLCSFDDMPSRDGIATRSSDGRRSREPSSKEIDHVSCRGSGCLDSIRLEALA